MNDVGYIKYGHGLKHVKLNLNQENEHNYPPTTLHSELLTINDKLVSFEMLYAIINKRFHTCL